MKNLDLRQLHARLSIDDRRDFPMAIANDDDGTGERKIQEEGRGWG
ncbi:hypothetical protein TIFTF001_045011 [Ficus carica]|uniref:Uncharacterized protein n=1 Tax=Ficus carica TaxID=3494 RepID=A0AA88CZ73_FICCA|nr:hypothetical protein TIFTF001_045011 [Ficus carica]